MLGSKLGVTMKFSFSEVWADTVRMLRTNASLLLALAGAFLFLPALLLGYFVPQPAGAETADQMIRDMQAYMIDNWHWIMLSNILNMIGAIAIYLLLFERQGRTVGGAIAAALPILPFYFILSFLTTLAILFGLILLVIPGIYLLGRLVVSGATMVAEGHRNPLRAVGRSWVLSKGRGWAVAGLVMLVGIAGYALTAAITAVLGSVFILIGGQEGLGGLLVLILTAALSAVFSLVMIVLFAAAYGRLTALQAESPPSN